MLYLSFITLMFNNSVFGKNQYSEAAFKLEMFIVLWIYALWKCMILIIIIVLSINWLMTIDS